MTVPPDEGQLGAHTGRMISRPSPWLAARAGQAGNIGYQTESWPTHLEREAAEGRDE